MIDLRKQIVIDIDDEVYKEIKEGLYDKNVRKMAIAIGNGTPLPKGHGNLKDVDSIFNEGFPMANINAGCEENIKKYPLWRTDITGFQSILKNAPTIIEADKAERSE